MYKKFSYKLVVNKDEITCIKYFNKNILWLIDKRYYHISFSWLATSYGQPTWRKHSLVKCFFNNILFNLKLNVFINSINVKIDLNKLLNGQNNKENHYSHARPSYCHKINEFCIL